MNKIYIYLTIILGTLSGCNPFMLVRPDSEKLVTTGWAKQPRVQNKAAPLYCYGTIGDKVCYAMPQTGAEKRLTGYYGAKP